MSADTYPQDNLPLGRPPLDMDEASWAGLLHEQENAAGNGHLLSRGFLSDKWDDAPQNRATANYSDSSNQKNSRDWSDALNAYESDETIELSVAGYNRGGLLVNWNTLRGFVPASQLNNFPVDTDDLTRRDMLAKRIGQNLKLRIIELDVTSGRLILSERAALVDAGQRASILKTLKPGAICQATITNLCDFGAFADLGGIEGLLHISELSWGRVNHPRDILSSGQQLKVYVMSVDEEHERIALSIKRLLPDPWQSVEQRYTAGQIIEVTITNVVDFGAFASIEEGLEGLIHISELAEGQFLHPNNVIQEGQSVRVRILNIDGNARRLGLSLRQANANGNEP